MRVPIWPLWVLFLLILTFYLSFFTNPLCAEGRVRRVYLKKDAIATVRTSVGIATIIQVPDRPNSVVVGDQQSFKVEYLENAITIKPLVPSGRTNLYVYTDWRRWNVELVAGGEAVADYVVYLLNPKEVEVKEPKLHESGDEPIRLSKYQNYMSNEEMKISVTRIGSFSKSFLIAELKIETKEDGKFKPEWLWLSQEGQTKPIHQLRFTRLEVSKERPGTAILVLRRDDLNRLLPIRLEMRRKRTSYMTLPKAGAWK